MYTKEFFQKNFKHLNGFLAINKPKNICINKIALSTRLEIYHSLDLAGLNFGKIVVNYARFLEPYASGLVTLVLGHGNYRRRNFALAEYKYRLKVEFGVERTFNTIDGDIIGYAKINNVNSKTIEDNLKPLQGGIVQSREPIYIDDDTPTLRLTEDSPIVNSLYRLINMERAKKEKSTQKYPFESPGRVSRCHVELVDYFAPYGIFEITCQGNFSTRRFAASLAESLGTKASIVELTRLSEGPMSLDDLRVVQLHEMNVETYVNRLRASSSFYNNYIKQFDGRFEQPPRIEQDFWIY